MPPHTNICPASAAGQHPVDGVTVLRVHRPIHRVLWRIRIRPVSAAGRTAPDRCPPGLVVQIFRNEVQHHLHRQGSCTDVSMVSRNVLSPYTLIPSQSLPPSCWRRQGRALLARSPSCGTGHSACSTSWPNFGALLSCHCCSGVLRTRCDPPIRTALAEYHEPYLCRSGVHAGQSWVDATASQSYILSHLQITTVDEAKQFYPLFGLGANVALIFSGRTVVEFSKVNTLSLCFIKRTLTSTHSYRTVVLSLWLLPKTTGCIQWHPKASRMQQVLFCNSAAAWTAGSRSGWLGRVAEGSDEPGRRGGPAGGRYLLLAAAASGAQPHPPPSGSCLACIGIEFR